ISDAGENDWIWKSLVHGNALDIRFIKRLKNQEKYDSLRQTLEKNYYEAKGGLKVKDGNKKYSSLSFKNFRYVEPSDFKPYKIDFNTNWSHEAKTLSLKNWEVGFI